MTAPPPATQGPVRHELPPELLHDLRTPLAQIIGYSELLMEQAQEAGDDGYVADLRKVSAAGYRLRAMMEASFQSVRPVAAGPTCLLEPDEGPDATR
ncbi:MAG TPA: histidine kinase dimerization/phospho-acceptor domain-containing protein [Longimicrobium sp.]|nr:histidine kinase dimerization/phospho-acceptor domain-containing protein [Longimicrobium sp.]